MGVFRQVAPTVTRAVTTTSARVALTAPGSVGEYQVRLVNAGSYTTFIAFGDASVAATVAAGLPMLANTCEVFTVTADVGYVAAINDSGASGVNLYITTGLGA
jgi:hypothetical protein